MSSVSEYSIWLLPAKAQEQRLCDVISRLSPAFGGVDFAPHVTIQGDIRCPLDELSALLARIAAETTVQSWRVLQAECSDHFFRCLYLRFERLPAFEHLQQAASHFTGTADGLSPYPHLSLAYGLDQPEAPRQREILSAEFTGQCLMFDRIAVCQSSKNIAIADWRCLVEYPLLAG